MGGVIPPGEGEGGNPPSVWTSTMVPDDGDTSFKICHQMSPASGHLYKEEPQVVLASCVCVCVLATPPSRTKGTFIFVPKKYQYR